MILITPDEKKGMSEYLGYLKRYARKNQCTMPEANKLMLSRLVGRYHGLSDKEMDSIDWKSVNISQI